jgi:transcriptional regulator with XRE-family HTH domain
MTSTLHDPNYRAFVSHLAGLRVQLGVTQAELARRLGKPQSFVSKAERFERWIDPGEFRAIALVLGVDPAVEFKDVSDRLARS